jgi:putative hydrolase of the HAD superfamily
MPSGRPTVFIDAGGTLLRPARPVGETYARLAEHYGVSADPARVHEGFLAAWKALKPRDPVQGARVMDDRGWWREVVRRSWAAIPLPPTFPFEDYFAEVYAAFERPELWRVFPEVPSVLDGLRARGIRCAVLSNWDRRLRTLLEALELASCFDSILISSEIGAEKPHPAIFRAAETALAVAPSQAILWGDEPEADAAGAHAAGWRYRLVDRPRVDLADLLAELLQTESR